MGNTFSFVGGDQAIAGEDGWEVRILIDDWDERFLGSVYLQLSELDTSVGRRDSFGAHESGRSLDDLGTIECTIARGSGGIGALPFVCSGIHSTIAAADTRHSFVVRLPTGGMLTVPQWSEPIRVPIGGEVAGESSEEGDGYEIDFTFKNPTEIPTGTGRRETAVPAHSAIAPRRTTRDTPRSWIRLDFQHCPACWVLARKISLLRRPASPRTDKIVGGNLWVGGKYFVDWFNQDFSPHHRTGPHEAGFSRGSLPYRNTFLHWYEHCADLWATELSVAQFAVTFAITYNESTGFLPRSEAGDISYLFEYRRHPTRERRKNSYNRYGFHRGTEGVERTPGHNANHKAGDQLRAWWNDTVKGAQMRADGLTEEMLQYDVWNGVWWKDRVDPPPYVDNPPRTACPLYGEHAPNPNLEDNPALAHWVRQTDFNKLRGRGMMQSTGRPHYIAEIRPALHAAGYPDFDELTDDELDAAIMRDLRVSLMNYRLALQNIDTNHGGAMTRLGSEVSGALFGEVGEGYSGGSGTDKVRWRSTQLHDAIVAAGWESRPLSDAGLSGIRAGGSDTQGIRALQTILADLGYGGTPSGTFETETGNRLRDFNAFFSVQGAVAQQLSLESAVQLLKWHEARHAHGVRTVPSASTTEHHVEAPPPEHPPAMSEEVSVPETEEPPPEEAAGAGDDAVPEDAAESAAPVPPAGPPPEPEPTATAATHDEHDTIPVEPFFTSHAMGHIEELERVARDPVFRRGDGEPLQPGNARATEVVIRAIQTALRTLGYDLGTGGPARDGIDARWSARGRTVRAIQQHQRGRGPAWLAAGDPMVRSAVRSDGRADWVTLYILDRDARVAEDAATEAAIASSAPVRTAPSTPSEPVASRPESGPAADRPARALTRREALEQIAALNDADGVGMQILDPDRGGPDGYGDYPDCRVLVPSPCYGVVLRRTGWNRTQVDPRLALGVARLCRWLHDRGVIGILQHEGTGGFLGNADRGGGPHGHGCALDLSSFDFDADHAAADHNGIDRLVVGDADLWPRYDARRFRIDGDPGLLSAGWRYASGSRADVWRSGNTHPMHWVHGSGRVSSTVRFRTGDSSAPFERLHRLDAESPDMLVRADGVAAELELFRDASLLPMCTRPSHVDTTLPFGSFITDLYVFVQREFKVNDTIDAVSGRSATVALEEFKGLVNPCHPRLGHGQARDEGATSRADGAGPRARFGHQDHLHLEVPDIDPPLPYPRD